MSRAEPKEKLDPVVELYRALPLDEMADALQQMNEIYAAKYREAQALVERLRSMGVSVLEEMPPPAFYARGQKVPAKYRSHEDPDLTWSGRGKVARWLEAEMERSGLPKEAFEVKSEQK